MCVSLPPRILFQLHPVEFARQLTLIQSEYFRAIHASELVDASWMKEEQKERASPHLLRLNRFETTVRRMTVSVLVFCFVTCVAVPDRTQILEKIKHCEGEPERADTGILCH